MTSEPQVSQEGPYRVLRCLGSPVRRVNSTLFLGPPIRGNAMAEELTWPVVSPVRRVNSTFLDGPPIRGNATAEELTWPVVSTGSEVITPSADALLPQDAESEIDHFSARLDDLFSKMPPSERGLLLQQLHRLIARVAAEHPAA